MTPYKRPVRAWARARSLSWTKPRTSWPLPVALRFYYAESCGQCTPCREGTGWMHRMIHRIMTGEGRMEDLDVLGSVTTQIEGHTICAFGEAAAWPVQGFLRHFREEFEHYIEHGYSMVTGKRSEVIV